MRRETWLIAAGVFLVASGAFADAPPPPAAPPASGAGASCADAHDKAQSLRAQHKLLDTREALRSCAAPTCKDYVRNDCVPWLDEVQALLPSVVFEAKDEAGGQVDNVKVSEGGKVLTARIDGTAVELDPGNHTFHFETADGKSVDKSVLVAEHEKGKSVVGLFPAPAGAPVAAGGAPAEGAPAGAVATPPEGSSAGPWKPLGLTLAGVGVVGLGLGTVFGLQASSKQSDANCPSNMCKSTTDATKLRDAASAGNLSTVFFIAGGVLAATGVTMWLLAPSNAPVQAAPEVGPTQASFVLRGRF